ncbi:MAG: hypothetical protein LBB58_00915 [Cellulomonadaceae bacterium]|jgi:hypothetical protein|nr:hypothetical protein [Cellulomonadaceae bacterium]
MKKQKFLALGVAAALGVIPLAGCGGGLGSGMSERNLIGSWDCVDDGDGYPYPVEFFSDGTLSLNGDPGIWRLNNSRSLELGPYGDTYVTSITSNNRNSFTVADNMGTSYCTRR